MTPFQQARALLTFVVPMLVASALPSAQSTNVGPTISVAAPEPMRLVLALDELELDWTAAGAEREVLARSVAPVAGVRAVRREGLRAVLTVAAGSESEIASMLRAAEEANAGAEGRLVLYEAGAARTEQTRHLLTREVAVFLDPGVDINAFTAQIGAGPARPVGGVAHAWIVTAKDPLEALRVVEAASRIEGVRLAYPLLRRQHQLR